MQAPMSGMVVEFIGRDVIAIPDAVDQDTARVGEGAGRSHHRRAKSSKLKRLSWASPE